MGMHHEAYSFSLVNGCSFPQASLPFIPTIVWPHAYILSGFRATSCPCTPSVLFTSYWCRLQNSPDLPNLVSWVWPAPGICSSVKYSDEWGLPELPPPDGSVTVGWPSLLAPYSCLPCASGLWSPVLLFSSPPPYLLMSLFI